MSPSSDSVTAARVEPELLAKSEVPSAYLEALARIDFPLKRLQRLTEIRVRRVVLDLTVTACSLVAVPVLHALAPHGLTFAVCFFLSIRTFNCLAQLVHMSDHGALFPHPTANRIVGNLCAYCLGYTRVGHRLNHMDHHRYLNTERDPDRIWGAPDERTSDLFRRWLRDLCFVSALERLLQYSQSDRRTFSVAPWRSLSLGFLLRAAMQNFPVFLTQTATLLVYSVILGPTYYVALYVLPILTLYPAQIRLRSTVEHSFGVGPRTRSPQDAWVSRTIRGRLLERLIFAPLGINYHFEHHLFPGVPHYNLGRVHRLLVTSGFPVSVVAGYLAFVAEKHRAERTATKSRLNRKSVS